MVIYIITYYNLFVNRLCRRNEVIRCLIGDDPFFDHSLAVHVIDAVLDHVAEITGEESFDVFFVCTFDIESLVRDVLLDSVQRCQGTVLALMRESVCEHKLTGG